MESEKIKVQTESGQTLEVVVTDKQPDVIYIAIGEGINNVKCRLVPSRNGLAYVGNVMGREIIYARSVKEVKADIAQSETMRFQHKVR
ncbi:MAG: hypothetical protein IBX47_06550 [Desulfuromonadales bacterium]|nr:hypothetical protein [Desulfuromonadales bacterium]